MDLDGGFVILDNLYKHYYVKQPFQIQCFRTLSEYRLDKDHLFLGESHNFWEFTLILEGEIEGVIGDKVYLLQPGDLMCCPPMVFHSSRSTGLRCHLLNFSFETAGTMPPVLKDGIFHLLPAEISEMKNIVYRLRDAYLREVYDEDMGAEATNALASLILRLSKHHTPHNQLSNSRSSRLYQQVIEAMQQALYENLSVQEIARRNAISTTTIKELFRNYAGVGPKKYYSDMRGIEALRLLSEGMDIAEISEKMNYSSVGYFSNVFKKQFGAPPSRYRKRMI